MVSIVIFRIDNMGIHLQHLREIQL